MQYLLKVFSGPHVGAEVTLFVGETVVGSGDDCDVVLDDRLVGKRHVLVTVNEDDIQVESLDGQVVLVDGQPIKKETVRPFQFFTIGTTHLAIGPADKPWPHFDLTDFKLREPTEMEIESAQGSSDVAPSTREHEPEEVHHGKSRRPMSARAWSVAAFVGMNLLLLAVFLNGFDSGEAAAAVEHTSVESQLHELLHKYSRGVTLENAAGTHLLTGYVQTIDELNNLGLLAQAIDPHIVVKVRANDSLLASVNELLKNDRWQNELKAESAGPGIILISGRLPLHQKAVRARWQQTRTRIEDDVPLKRLQIDIKEEATEPDSNENEVAMTTRMPVPAPNSAKLQTYHSQPISVLDVRISHDRVFTLADGQQISVGGRLPDGSWVEAIELDHAVLLNAHGHRIIIPFRFGG